MWKGIKGKIRPCACVSDMAALARFHTMRRRHAEQTSPHGADSGHSVTFVSKCFFCCQCFLNNYRFTLVTHLPSLTPLFHPHKHMLLCVRLLWRTRSTSNPRLSLVNVSCLCGRTGSDRMDCCVIDFNLESAACCFPPSFCCQDPAGPHL